MASSNRKALFDDDNDRKDIRYPRLMPITLSHSEFPATYDLMAQAGQPFGCIVRPFLRDETVYRDYNKQQRSGLNLARCGVCAAYISALSESKPAHWFCALCGSKNNFDRKQSRYRHADLQLVPELQEVLFDYRLPLLDLSDPLSATATTATAAGEQSLEAMSSEHRPLVHVFLVQESMQIDTLQATVESLTAAVRDLHPEIRVVLLTFSNRIGVYCLNQQARIPTVQYVHFTTAAAATEDKSKQQHQQQELLESQELQDLNLQSGCGIAPLLPLTAVAEFLDVATPIGECRDAFESAVSSLFDAFGSSGMSSSDGLAPRVLLGPALEAVGQWILDPPTTTATPTTAASFSDSNSNSSSSSNAKKAAAAGGIMGLVSDVSIGIWSAVAGIGLSTTATSTAAAAAASNNYSNNSNSSSSVNSVLQSLRQRGAIDSCNGVVLHLFLDAAQDLPPGTHSSVASESPPATATTAAKHQQQHQYKGSSSSIATNTTATTAATTALSAEWVHRKAQQFSQRSLCVNIWALSSFGSSSMDLLSIDSLPQLTGGRLHRIVLGSLQPQQQQRRLQQMLRRSLINRIATRGLLRLRASRFVDVSEQAATGFMLPHPQLPDVFTLAAATADTSLGFELKYSTKHVAAADKFDVMVLQLAYSYETLVTEEEFKHPAHIRYDKYSDIQHALKHNCSSSSDSNGSIVDGSSGGSSSFCSAAMEALGLQRVYAATAELFASRFSSARMSAQHFTSAQKTRDNRQQPPLFEIDALADRTSDFPMRDVELTPTTTSDAAVDVASRGDAGAAVGSEWVRQHQRLFAVRRLRVFTAYTECSSKRSRLLQVAHIPTIASLLLRRALSEERRLLWSQNNYAHLLRNSNSDQQQQQQQQQQMVQGTIASQFERMVNLHTPGVRLLVNAAVDALLSATRLYLQSAAAGDSRNSNSSSSSSGYLAVTHQQPGAPVALTADAAVQTMLSHPAVHELLLCILAAIDRIVCLIQRPLLLSTAAATASSRSTAATATAGDELAELDSIVQTADSFLVSKMLHPLLAAVSSDLLLQPQLLPLTRASVAASQHKYFYLDAGDEIILYSTAAAVATAAAGKDNNNNICSSSSFEHLETAGAESDERRSVAVFESKTAEVDTDEAVDGDEASSDEEALRSDNSGSDGDSAAAAIGVMAPARRQQDALFRRATVPLATADATDAAATATSVDINQSNSCTNNNSSSSVASLREVSLRDEFLIAFLQRRLRCGDVVPRVSRCAAGTASAAAFSARLLQEGNRSCGVAFPAFADFVAALVKSSLSDS